MTEELSIHDSRLRPKIDVVICSPTEVPKSTGFHQKGGVIAITLHIRPIIAVTPLMTEGAQFFMAYYP